MIIDLTAVSIYTLCTSVLGASAHILTFRDIDKIKKTLKIHRMELTGLEAVSVINTAVSVIERKIYKRTFTKLENSFSQTANNMEHRVDVLMDRVNNIDLSTIQMKQDAVLEELKKASSKKEETKES